MQLATYELKYCERCGSLRVHRAASAETYCTSCEHLLANYSLPSHGDRARLLLRKPRGKASIAPAMSDATQAALPFGRPQ